MGSLYDKVRCIQIIEKQYDWWMDVKRPYNQLEEAVDQSHEVVNQPHDVADQLQNVQFAGVQKTFYRL